MVFKTIESDITRSGQSLSIFGKEIKNIYRDFSSAVDGIKNKTGNISQFSIGRIFGNKLSQQDIQAIKNYNEEIKKYNQMTDDAVSPQTAFYKCLGNSSSAAQQLAREANGVAVSEELLTQNTQTLTFAQKASAAASQVMGVALNMALNLGIGLIINAIITGITKLVNKQKELAEQAKESAEEIKEQAKSLEELKKRYEEICNSTDDEKKKNEQLNEIKQELVETYKIEEDKLKNLNLERENGNKLLEEEIKLVNQKERGNWLGKNAKAIKNAQNAIEANYSGYRSGIIVADDFSIDGKINLDNIDKSILEMFDDVKHLEYGKDEVALINQQTQFIVAGDDMIEKYEKIQEIISELGNKTDRTDEEERLLKLLNKESESMQSILNIHRKTYELEKQATAENLFDNYLTDNPTIEINGKEAYLAWRNGLLKTADGDKRVKQNLLALAEEQFPDYEEYYKNLDKAYSEFNLNSASEANKIAFVNTLDDTDLDILVNKIEDPFKNGIEGAKKAIEDFKADPKNQINVETDTSSLEEMEKKLEEYSKSVSSFTKAQDTISDAYGEQAKHGQLASDTIQSLIDAGYASALVIDKETGAVTLNASAVEALNNQKKFSLLLDAQKQKADLVKQLEDEKSKIDALTSSLMTNNEEKKKSYVTDLLAAKANAEQIESQIAMYDALMASLDAPNFDDSSKKKSDDPWKDQFENEYNEKQHLLALNQISEEEYINWLDDAYKQYFSDLTKYQDEYWKYEEEVYKWRTEQEQKLFDKKIDNYEKLADKALEDNVDADGNKLELSLSFDYAREQLTNAITELQQRINDIRTGVVSGTEDDIEQLEEDIDSLNDKLKDIDDKEVTAERDFLKDKKDEYSDFYDEQIDKLKEQQDEAEKLADQEKEAIQAKIDLLEEANSKKSEEIDLEKKRQELEKAKSQRTIARLNADGTTSYVADAEKINDTQEEYDNAKYEYQKSLLEAQIKAIEKAAKEQSEKYDDQIKLIEEQKKMIEEKFDALIKPLDDFLDGDKQTASNTNVWDMISKISGSTYENGVWSDKDGNAIDINSLIAGIDDLTEQEKENSKTSDIPQKKSDSKENSKTGDGNSLRAHYELLAKYFQNKSMKNVTADSLEKYSMNLINNGLAFKNPVPNLSENVATKTVAYNNSRHTENITNNIGDIIINNPVGSAEDLGKEILKNGATIFNQQTHTNRK